MRDLFNTASVLDDDEILIINFEFSDYSHGTITLSNFVNVMTKQRQNNLRKILKTIDEYITDIYTTLKDSY